MEKVKKNYPKVLMTFLRNLTITTVPALRTFTFLVTAFTFLGVMVSCNSSSDDDSSSTAGITTANITLSGGKDSTEDDAADTPGTSTSAANVVIDGGGSGLADQ